MTELTAISRTAYRALVEQPGFAVFFGSDADRPHPGTGPGLAAGLRGQADGGRTRRRTSIAAGHPVGVRVVPVAREPPGWYGLGTALEAVTARGGQEIVAHLGRLYARWPFFASVIDNAELSLAKADLGTFRRYADLASGDEATAIRA